VVLFFVIPGHEKKRSVGSRDRESERRRLVDQAIGPCFLLEKESLSIILNTETVRVLLRARVREWQRGWHRIILSWSENNKKVVGTRSEFRGISTMFAFPRPRHRNAAARLPLAPAVFYQAASYLRVSLLASTGPGSAAF